MDKKVVVITGGSEGLGKVIAERLAKNCQVVIVARTEAKLSETAEGLGCDYRVGDVTDYEQMNEVVKSVVEKYRRIDCLVNNAGIWIEGELVDNDPEKIQKVIEVNVLGTMNVTKAVVPGMIKQGEGVVVNIVSMAGVVAAAKRSVYNPSKWAITGFTKSLQKELASKGIRVTGIYPGYMKTGLFRDYGDKRDAEKALSMEDVAKTIEFILSLDPKTHVLGVEMKNVDY